MTERDKRSRKKECLWEAECFGIEHQKVHSDLGLYRHTQAKATAFSLVRYLNEALGITPMNIARYAV